MASLLGYDPFLDDLQKPVIVAWTRPSGSTAGIRTEAAPLPLHVLASWELHLAKLRDAKPNDFYLFCALLIMLWAGLRFSDIQRVSVDEIEIEEGVARYCCWKTKSPSSPMPWRCLTAGVHCHWAWAVADLRNRMAGLDFLLAGPSGSWAFFAYVQGHMRRLLVEVAHMDTNTASAYTLHSLKATGLSWALQLGVDKDSRKAWGHHRCNSDSMVSKYCRDDVLPALRGQLQVIKAIRSGWSPLRPQRRGAKQPCEEVSLFPPCPLEFVPRTMFISGSALAIL